MYLKIIKNYYVFLSLLTPTWILLLCGKDRKRTWAFPLLPSSFLLVSLHFLVATIFLWLLKESNRKLKFLFFYSHWGGGHHKHKVSPKFIGLYLYDQNLLVIFDALGTVIFGFSKQLWNQPKSRPGKSWGASFSKFSFLFFKWRLISFNIFNMRRTLLFKCHAARSSC